jgi:hypothetical protein
MRTITAIPPVRRRPPQPELAPPPADAQRGEKNPGKHRPKPQTSEIWTSEKPAAAFIDNTAARTGKARSAVAGAAKRGKEISADDLSRITGTSLDKGVELDALARTTSKSNSQNESLHPETKSTKDGGPGPGKRNQSKFWTDTPAPAFVEDTTAKTDPAKACRTCGEAKPLDAFARHRLAKDGHCHSCRDCARSARAKEPAPVALEEVRQQRPRSEAYLRNNRAAVRAWSLRNPEAVVARSKLRRAVRAGRIVPAGVCQAAGCTERENLQGHHANYSKPLAVAWLCAKHHRRAHAAGIARLKRGVPRKLGKVPKTRRSR